MEKVLQFMLVKVVAGPTEDFRPITEVIKRSNNKKALENCLKKILKNFPQFKDNLRIRSKDLLV